MHQFIHNYAVFWTLKMFNEGGLRNTPHHSKEAFFFWIFVFELEFIPYQFHQAYFPRVSLKFVFLLLKSWSSQNFIHSFFCKFEFTSLKFPDHSKWWSFPEYSTEKPVFSTAAVIITLWLLLFLSAYLLTAILSMLQLIWAIAAIIKLLFACCVGVLTTAFIGLKIRVCVICKTLWKSIGIPQILNEGRNITFFSQKILAESKIIRRLHDQAFP